MQVSHPSAPAPYNDSAILQSQLASDFTENILQAIIPESVIVFSHPHRARDKSEQEKGIFNSCI